MDRQGIHIGAQFDRGAIAGSENADHTGLADVAMDLAAKFGKLTGDKLGCAMLLEAKLGCACRYKFERSTLGEARK
jgi:hypothetical protein